MSKNQYMPLSSAEILATDIDILGTIAKKSYHLYQTQQAFSKIVGANIAENCKISNFSSGCLSILCQQAMVALHLKMKTPQIVHALQEQGLQHLDALNIQIDPKLFALNRTYHNPVKPITESTQNLLTILAEKTEHPISQSLLKLATTAQETKK